MPVWVCHAAEVAVENAVPWVAQRVHEVDSAVAVAVAGYRVAQAKAVSLANAVAVTVDVAEVLAVAVAVVVVVAAAAMVSVETRIRDGTSIFGCTQTEGRYEVSMAAAVQAARQAQMMKMLAPSFRATLTVCG